MCRKYPWKRSSLEGRVIHPSKWPMIVANHSLVYLYFYAAIRLIYISEGATKVPISSLFSAEL